MDPNACLNELIAALIIRDDQAAGESANALLGWLASGGFMPALLENQDRMVIRKELRYICSSGRCSYAFSRLINIPEHD